MSKKTIIILGSSVIGVLVVLLLVVWLMSVLNPAKYSYTDFESKVAKACENYYKDKPDALPKEDGKYNLSYQTLVDGKYVKPLEDMLEDSTGCSVSIVVTKRDTAYSYIPYLNCGDKYVTKELYKQILESNEVVNTGSGLYVSDTGEYYYRGKVTNNYVAFGTVTKKKDTSDRLWRIISINDNTIKLRAVVQTDERTNWDDRYNSDKKGVYGYNDFDLSIFQEFLTGLYNNNTILNSAESTKLKANKLCIATRSKEDTTMDGSSECSKLSTNDYYFSTITPYEYMRASLDTNCTTLVNRSCTNFNFISDATEDDEWTVTAFNENTYQVYSFDGIAFDENNAKSKRKIYPVISINEYAFFNGGTGTESDPYRIR